MQPDEQATSAPPRKATPTGATRTPTRKGMAVPQDPAAGPIKPGPATGPVRTGPATGPVRTGPATGSVKPGPAPGPVRTGATGAIKQPGPATGPIRTGATGPVRTGATGPIKPGTTGSMQPVVPAKPIAQAKPLSQTAPSRPQTPAALAKPLAQAAQAAQAARQATDDPLLGTIVEERYRLERLLGSGGMSRVYLGTHLRAGGKLAIKLIDLRLSNKPDMVQRCLQEARTMMEIQSNYVVRAYDVGVLPSGQLYIVMEHLAGDDLEHLVQREGPIPWARLAPMAVQICSGLSAAHKRGTIHRDIKPQNCFRVSIDGNPDHIKLIDFGIARDANAEVGLTQDGMILGTPEYMAPELVVAGNPPDARSDIYAVGAMLYKLVTGNPPFRGRDALDTLYQHRNTPVVPPSQAAPQLNIPPEVDEILGRALSKAPADRYANIDEMAEAIRASAGMPARTGVTLPEIVGAQGMRASSPSLRGSTQPIAAVEPTHPGRAGASQEVSTSDLRPISARDIAIRGATLLSMSLFFGVASWLAAPAAPPAPTVAVAQKSAPEQKPPEAAPEPQPEPTPEPPVATPPADSAAPVDTAAPVADSAAPADTAAPVADTAAPVADSAAPVADTAAPVADTAAPVADTAAVVEPAATTATPPVDPPPVDPPPVDPTGAAPVDKPVDPPPADAPPADAPPADAPPADAPPVGVIEPDFDYKAAKKYVDEQKDYLLKTCLAKADKPASRLNLRIDVRASGRPTVKVFSSSKAVRDCARELLSFHFDPSPRGGAFTYMLTQGGGTFEKQPVDPTIVK